MTSIKDETGNVFLGHFGKLFRKEGFETDESDEGGGVVVVTDDETFYGVVGVGWLGWWGRGGGGDIVVFDVGGGGRLGLRFGVGWRGYVGGVGLFGWSGRLFAFSGAGHGVVISVIQLEMVSIDLVRSLRSAEVGGGKAADLMAIFRGRLLLDGNILKTRAFFDGLFVLFNTYSHHF